MDEHSYDLERPNVYTILIVDDDHENLKLLSLCLNDSGHKILVAQNGMSAMKKAELSMPDLILMDVIMPEIDGFEICRLMKANRKLVDIPIIFMTSLTDSNSMLKAFEVGGVDYISKPFKFEEIKARVNIQLRIRLQRQLIEANAEEVASYNEELIALNEELIALNEELTHSNEELFKEIKERQIVQEELKKANEEINKTMMELEEMQAFLVQSEKMAALGNLVAGLAHEINTPIGVAITASSHLEEISSQLVSDEINALRYVDDVVEASKIVTKNLLKAGKLIRNFKLVSTDQSIEEKRLFNLCEYIDEILLSLKPMLKKEKHSIVKICDDHLELFSYPGAFAQVFTNLITNAFIHGFSHIDKGTITIHVKKIGEKINVIFEDDGCGMDTYVVSKLFDPFYTTSRHKGGSGLGMYIVYNIVTQQLNGKIKCISELNKGTKYIIEF